MEKVSSFEQLIRRVLFRTQSNINYEISINRSSHSEVFLEKGVLKKSANLQENTQAEV